MAELGLNVFQVIQNELITRENNRSTLGLGFRLAIIEDRITNAEAVVRNGKVWKLHHAISPIKAPSPESRDRIERQRKKLLGRKGANKDKDDKDPTMMMRDDEKWELHRDYPRTILDFKKLQFNVDRVRDLLEFYNVKAYRPDQRLINIDPEDHWRDVHSHLETCMEELAMAWGLDWFRIGGLAIPQPL